MSKSLLALTVLLGIAGSLLAQTESGIITGRLADAQGGSIPSSKVELANQLTNAVVSTTSEVDGSFTFVSVLPGIYTVCVSAAGFKQFQKTNLKLTSSDRLSAGTLTLEVGAVNESVTVTSDATPVQTASSERSGLIDSKQTEQLLSIGRDFSGLLRILPGVVGGGGSSSLNTASTPFINGVRSEYNAANVDGVTGNTRGIGGVETPPNLDSIAEIKVLSSNYQAESGTVAGSQINLVTKSGTRMFHGTGYYYVRNEDFNANSFFNNLNGLPRPRYRYNTVGGNVGGPIFWPRKVNRDRNRLFFFYSQEYTPIKTPEGLKLYTVPTPIERLGDFSQTLDQNKALIVVKDPNNGGAPFAGNVIPPNRINPITKNLLNIFPAPNFTNRAISGGNYNFITNNVASQPTQQQLLRVDYNVVEKLRVFFRGLNQKVDNNGYSSPANALPWLAKADYQTHHPNIALNATYTATPSLINEFTAGIARWTEDQIVEPSQLDLLKKSTYGLQLGQLYPQNNPLGLLPQLSFGGIPNAAGGGPGSRYPLQDVVQSLTFSDNLTKVWNNHIFKAGVLTILDRYYQAHQGGGGSFAGGFAFDRTTTNPYDSNYAYSNALLGNFAAYQEINNRPDYNPHTRTFEWFVQDQWRISKKLTLDLGARFTWALAQTVTTGSNFLPSLYNPAQAPTLYQPIVANGVPSAVNPLTGQLYPAVYYGLFVPGTGSVTNGTISVDAHGHTPNYPASLVYGTGVHVAPRIGFAYDPFGDGKTAIRGGFGIFNNARSRTGQEGDSVGNPPTVFTVQEFYGNVSTFLNAGTLLGPPNVPHALELHPRIASAYNMSFGIQRKIWFGAVADVAYVGTLGRHLSDYININLVPFGSHFLASSRSPFGGVLPDNFMRPYPGYGNITQQIWGLTSSYHSLQSQVTRRFSHGLQFGVVWTYSKALDYNDNYDGTLSTYVNPRVYNYGLAGYDRRHNFVVNYVWDIPKASKVLPSQLTRWTLDGWQVSGIASYVTGRPNGISFSTVDGADITGGGDPARVLLTCDPNRGGQKSFTQWFNTSCVQRPAQGTWGNAPFAPITQPSTFNMDTALFKNVSFRDKVTLQLRVETYNTLNKTQFSGINTSARFDKNGAQVNSSFGQLSSTNNPRYMQLAVRLRF